MTYRTPLSLLLSKSKRLSNLIKLTQAETRLRLWNEAIRTLKIQSTLSAIQPDYSRNCSR